jgi:hypothetical protein
MVAAAGLQVFAAVCSGGMSFVMVVATPSLAAKSGFGGGGGLCCNCLAASSCSATEGMVYGSLVKGIGDATAVVAVAAATAALLLLLLLCSSSSLLKVEFWLSSMQLWK